MAVRVGFQEEVALRGRVSSSHLEGDCSQREHSAETGRLEGTCAQGAGKVSGAEVGLMSGRSWRARAAALGTGFPQGQPGAMEGVGAGRTEVFTDEPLCAWQCLGRSLWAVSEPQTHCSFNIYLTWILLFYLNTFILKRELPIFTIVASSCLSNR